jgi:glucose/arabinose dehydrogenase
MIIKYLRKLISSIKITFFVIVFFSNINLGYAQNIENGAKLFETNCATCHNFKTDGIGPQLGGLSEVVSETYLSDLIKNPKALIDARNGRAFRKYLQFKSIMPSFDYLQASEIQDVIAFILEKPAPKTNKPKGKIPLENPIKEEIKMSGISLNIKKVVQFPFTNEKQPRTRLNKMVVHPITKQIMVADLQGQIYILNDENQPQIFFKAKDHFKNFINSAGLAVGLGSFAFHPDFAKNKLFYTTHTEPKNSAKADFAYADSIPVKMQWVVNEWFMDDINSNIFSGKPRELMRVNVISQIHGMQEIIFNPYSKPNSDDYGLLYIGLGDGGSIEEGYPFVPDNKNNIWGKVLRINPTGNNSKNGQYGVPKTNPFVGKNGIDEAFAEGFRNPNRISFLKDGKILVSNIGQRQIESLYWLKSGKNYGWPRREGTFSIESLTNINDVLPLPKNDVKYNYTYPIAQFDHDEGNAIMGGFEYLGNEIPHLKGKYIFGEIVRGRVFYININEIKEGTQAKIHELSLKLDGQSTTLKELSKANKVDFRIGQDTSGEVYFITKDDGMMYKVVK